MLCHYKVQLPVRMSLRQNFAFVRFCFHVVQLPVRMSLRQNQWTTQSLRCFVQLPVRMSLRQNVQRVSGLTAQVQLPVRMSLRQNRSKSVEQTQQFSYQSECHCAKTGSVLWCAVLGLVTSQNVTAPKPHTTSKLAIFVQLPVRMSLRQNTYTMTQRVQ